MTHFLFLFDEFRKIFVFFFGAYLSFDYFCRIKTKPFIVLSGMTKEERHEMIMEALIKHGSVLVSDLVSMLNVSAVTVRKDLTDLYW